jgi:hypothetical protein
MTEQTNETVPSADEVQKEKIKHYRKIAIAVLSAITVGLGVYLEAIPISIVTDMFSK